MESVPAEEAELPLLNGPALGELTRLGATIKGLEGLAQDVKWSGLGSRRMKFT